MIVYALTLKMWVTLLTLATIDSHEKIGFLESYTKYLNNVLK